MLAGHVRMRPMNQFSGWIKFGPWIVILGLVLGLGYIWHGLSQEKTKRTEAEAAVKGGEENLKALELALKNKDRKIQEIETRLARTSCDGTWVEILSPDGTVRRECKGKTSISEDSSKKKDSEEKTPDVKPPYQPPAGAQKCPGLWPLGIVVLADLGLPDHLGTVSWAAGPTWAPGPLKLPLIPEIHPSIGAAIGGGSWGLRVLAVATARFGK
jgi:hypothetical protein